jgi:hypothetical protein
MPDKNDIGFVPLDEQKHDDIGFVPLDQAQKANDLGFQPQGEVPVQEQARDLSQGLAVPQGTPAVQQPPPAVEAPTPPPQVPVGLLSKDSIIYKALKGAGGPIGGIARAAADFAASPISRDLQNRNLTAKAINVLAGNKFQKPQDYGFVGNLAADFAANAMDPVSRVGGWAAGGILKATPGIRALYSAAPGLADAAVAESEKLKLGATIFQRAWKPAAIQYVGNLLARDAVSGAANVGAYGGMSNLLDQANAGKGIDPLQVATAAAKNAGYGVILGPLFGAGTRGLFGNAELQNADAAHIVHPDTEVAHDRFMAVKEIDKQIAEAQREHAVALGDARQLGAVPSTTPLQDPIEGLLFGKNVSAAEQERLGTSVDAAAQRAAQLEPKLSEAPELPASVQKLRTRLDELAKQREVLESDLAFFSRNKTNPIVQAQVQNTRSRLGDLYRQQDALNVRLQDEAAAVEKAAGARRGQTQQAFDANQAAADDALATLERGSRNLSPDEGKALATKLQAGRGQQAAAVEGQTADLSARFQETQAKLQNLQALREAALGDITKAGSGKTFGFSEKAGGGVTKAQYLDSLTTQAKDAVKRLVDGKVIPADQAFTYTQDVVLQTLEQQGIKKSDVGSGVIQGMMAKFLNPVELMNDYDRKLGTRTVDTVYQLIKGRAQESHLTAQLDQQFQPLVSQLEKRGLSRDEASHLLQYVESTPQGPVFNPQPVASKSLVRPAYQGAIAPQDVLTEFPELAQLRQALDGVFQLHPTLADKMGYVNGYMPLISRRTGTVATSRGTEGIVTPGAMEGRLFPTFNPEVHETDLGKVLASYSRAISRHVAYTDAIPDIYQELHKLLVLGESGAYERYSRYVSDVLRLDPKTPKFAQEFAQNLVSANKATLTEVLRDKITSPDFFDELANAVNRVTYSTMALKSPRVLLLHALKPIYYLPAEVGPKYSMVGQQARFGEAKRFAQGFDKFLMNADPSELGNFDVAPNAQTNWLRKITNVLTFVTDKTTKPLMSAIEANDRRTAFYGAYKQFQAATQEGPASVQSAMDGLLTGEKESVLKALNKGGEEAAAQMYGIIRSYRTNFAYGLANTPEALRNDFAKLIPFTTFGRTNLARIAQDVTAGNHKELAARIAYPLAAMALFRGVTGHDVHGSEPIEEAGKAFAWNVLPLPQDIAKRYNSGRDKSTGERILNAATPLIPLYSDYDRIKKQYGKNYDATEAVTSFKPVGGSFLERLPPPYIKKLLSTP